MKLIYIIFIISNLHDLFEKYIIVISNLFINYKMNSFNYMYG